MGKFTGKGNQTVKLGNQSHKYNIKTSNGEESTNAFEIETSNLIFVCVCVYRLLYQNLMVIASQKPMRDTCSQKEKVIQTQH